MCRVGREAVVRMMFCSRLGLEDGGGVWEVSGLFLKVQAFLSDNVQESV